MTNQLSTPCAFQFQESHDVRIEVIDNEPWFCLKDVIEVLDIPRTSDLVQVAKDVVKNDTLKSRGTLDPKGVRKTDTLTKGGKQQLVYVNEPNLYRVIFRSNKPEAKQFQDWVFNEVLPQIRKTGSYNAPHPRQSMETLSAADMTNLKWLITIMTSKFKYKESWNQGIWYALRKATGVESPNPFSVEDIPVLAQECRRILEITNKASSLIIQFEKDTLKQVIRNNRELKPIADKMQNEFEQLMMPEKGIQQLAKFEEHGLRRLEQRIN